MLIALFVTFSKEIALELQYFTTGYLYLSWQLTNVPCIFVSQLYTWREITQYGYKFRISKFPKAVLDGLRCSFQVQWYNFCAQFTTKHLPMWREPYSWMPIESPRPRLLPCLPAFGWIDTWSGRWHGGTLWHAIEAQSLGWHGPLLHRCWCSSFTRSYSP